MKKKKTDLIHPTQEGFSVFAKYLKDMEKKAWSEIIAIAKKNGIASVINLYGIYSIDKEKIVVIYDKFNSLEEHEKLDILAKLQIWISNEKEKLI